MHRTPPIRRRSPLRWLALAALLVAALAAAQAGLYGPEAPIDVAYLRVVNATASGPLEPRLDGEAWTRLAPTGTSAYLALDPGGHTVALGERSVELELAPESFTTVALTEGEIAVIADTPLRDISRGLLTLYNLGDRSGLVLQTDGGTRVVGPVAPNAAASVAIRQAEVALQVVDADGEVIGRLEPRLYARGVAHAVFAMPPGVDPSLVYAEAGVAEAASP